MDIPDEEWEEFKNLIEEHGSKYYRGEVIRKKKDQEAKGKEYRIPDDPWRYEWSDVSAYKMFQAVNGELLYKSAYSYASDWGHWGPRSISIAVEDTMKTGTWGDKKLAAGDLLAAAWALQLGIQSLLQSLAVLDLRFSLVQARAVERLLEKMGQIASEAKSAAE